MPSDWDYLKEFLGNLFRDEGKERFGEVEQPWDFWGNIARYWGLDRASKPFVERETYVNPQWGKENIKFLKEIMED
jgi:hypothetical protein